MQPLRQGKPQPRRSSDKSDDHRCLNCTYHFNYLRIFNRERRKKRERSFERE